MAMLSKPLILFVLILALVVPASAISITAEPLGVESTTYQDTYSLSYDGTSEGVGIQRIGIDAPTNTTVSFTLTYGNGDTVTGSVAYHNDGFYSQVSEIDLGGVTSTYEYYGIEQMGRFYVAGYATNESTTTGQTVPGIVLYGSSFGLSAMMSDYVFYETGTDSDGVIYAITLTSNKPIDVVVMTNPRGEVASAKTKTFLEVVNEWVVFATSIASFVYETVVTLLYWLKFFFWDNLGLTVALYICITAAVAFNQSKDVFAAIQKFFRYQRSLYEFILSLWKMLVELIGTFRGIFRI